MPLVDLASVPLTAVSLLVVGLIGVALGTLVGLLVPREFEAAMIIVAVAGIQMALGRGGSDAERFLVYWPGVESLKTAAFAPVPDAATFLGLGVLYIVVLLGLSGLVWAYRTRIWRHAAALPRTTSTSTGTA